MKWGKELGAIALTVLLLNVPVFENDVLAQSGALAAEAKKDSVDVTVDGVLFTAYKFADSQKYPYFWPVNGPISGETVTTESSEPYPHHHSLFFGCDKVSGGNYWQESNRSGQIVSQRPKIVEASGSRVVFTDECLWRRPGYEPVIRDKRRITVTAPQPTVRLIDFEIVLEPLTEVRIDKSNHSLFSARVVTELNVENGGVLINADGKTGEKDTFGVESPWCDYSGSRNGVTEGIAILQNPGNRWYPCRWFTRDYGFFSPTPMNWLEEGYIVLPQGEPMTLRYRVVVHAGDAQTADIANLFEQYRRDAESPEARK